MDYKTLLETARVQVLRFLDQYFYSRDQIFVERAFGVVEFFWTLGADLDGSSVEDKIAFYQYITSYSLKHR